MFRLGDRSARLNQEQPIEMRDELYPLPDQPNR
jgi:hypothetical protein